MAELRLLAELEHAHPIITVGKVPVFTNIIIAENNVINKDQLERYNNAINKDQLERDNNVKTLAETARPLLLQTEPKKKVTGLEARRARRELLRLQRERNQIPINENPEMMRPAGLVPPVIPIHAAAAGMAAVMDRLHARVAVPPPEPVIANMDDPANIIAYEALPQDARERSFWNTIGKLNWHNTSDGAIGHANVSGVIKALNSLDLKVFKTQYTHLFEQTVMILDADGMFERNRLEGMSARAKVVSHIIALGPDQYKTLISDPEILQFLVESGECQSLNEILPAEIKV